jgi:hypothetical protein
MILTQSDHLRRCRACRCSMEEVIAYKLLKMSLNIDEVYIRVGD